MQTAQAILEQLGGNKFVAMTGAKNFLGDDNSLMFALPARLAKHGINKVRITLNESDLYDIEFFKFHKLEVETISTTSFVYCDNLRMVFEETTGLRTSL